MSNIFFFPYISDNLPAIGVITAPVIRNDASIQEDALYVILKSLIISGIAGSIIVSANIAIRPTQLKIASVTQGDLDIFSPVWPFILGGFTVLIPYCHRLYVLTLAAVAVSVR